VGGRDIQFMYKEILQLLRFSSSMWFLHITWFHTRLEIPGWQLASISKVDSEKILPSLNFLTVPHSCVRYYNIYIRVNSRSYSIKALIYLAMLTQSHYHLFESTYEVATNHWVNNSNSPCF
jgi:hypothetical protein